MTRTIILYGISISVTAFLLAWLDYRFWAHNLGNDLYIAVIAIIFITLGIWIGRQRGTNRDPQCVNHKAIAALGLTTREKEMLDYLAKGKSNKEIARILDLSPNTIKSHLANLYEKLGATNRTQAITKAIELSIYIPVKTGDVGQTTHLG